MKKNGFTLIEMLITMVIVAVVSVILTPAIKNIIPNQNKLMIKRAYNIVLNNVRELIENTQIYSPFDTNGTEIKYKGFDNTNSVTYNGTTYSGDTKFANLFLYSVDATKASSTSCTIDFKSKYTTVSTSMTCTPGTAKNGITWYVTNKPSSGDVAAYILVDVNGDKKPNCTQTDSKCSSKSSGFDRFVMQIMNNGEVLINNKDTWAKESVKVGATLN